MKKRLLAGVLVLTFIMATMLGGCGSNGVFAKKGESITATRGAVVDGRFVNETFDFSFAVTEDMTPMTDGEVVEFLGIRNKLNGSSGYTLQQMEQVNMGAAYDALFYLPDMVTNIIVCYENMDVSAEGKWIKPMAYAERCIELLETEQGYTTAVEPYTVEIGGKEYIRCDVKKGWATQTLIIRPEQNYMILITFTHKNDNAWVEEMLATFSTAK